MHPAELSTRAATAGTPARASVVVIGGGVMGLSAAYHLARAGVDEVVLVEKGALGEGSTSRAAGGVRALFSDEVNIRLGLRGLETFERFGQEMGQEIDLEQNGYLFLLSSAEEMAQFEANLELQNALGVQSRLLDVAEAVRLSPLVHPAGLVGAVYSPRDGHCTPESVVLGYATAARRLGVRILTQCEATGLCIEDDEVRAVETTRGSISTSVVLCAAGAWSGEVGAWAGIDLPVQPLRRQIAVTEAVPGLPPDLPFTIDFASSFYFHREGQGLLVGMPDPSDHWGFEQNRSEEWLGELAEAIAVRAPALGEVGIASGWAGLYEMTPDHNALVGESARVSRFLYATGFSGHGFLMGPAIGEVMADLYLRRQPFVDVSGFAVERFENDLARPELNVV